MLHEDFKNCKYDIHNIPENEEYIIHRYKDLELYADIFYSDNLPEGLTNDFVLKYLILTYEPSSPFAKMYNDLSKRKPQVLEYLGITKDEDVTEGIGLLTKLKDPSIKIRFLQFLKVQFNEDWQLLVMNQERYYKLLEEYIEVGTDPLDEKRKQEVLRDITKQIKDTRQEFLMGEKSKETEEAVHFMIAGESLNIRPEEYIRIYAEGKKFPYNLTSL